MYWRLQFFATDVSYNHAPTIGTADNWVSLYIKSFTILTEHGLVALVSHWNIDKSYTPFFFQIFNGILFFIWAFC